MCLTRWLATCLPQPTGKFAWPFQNEWVLTQLRLDGLNKNMRDWDIAFYGRMFNAACRNLDMPMIQYPEGNYPYSFLQLQSYPL
jgi:hypothetical protein